MGQLTALKVDDWYLDSITPDEIINYIYEGTTRRTMRAEKIQICMSRKYWGLTRFEDSLGDVKAAFEFKTSSDLTLSYFKTGRKFRCIRDEPYTADYLTGEGLQTQNWLYIGDDEEVPAGSLDTN